MTTTTARAAIYARYSSDLQREASIEDQVRLCRDRLEAEGWSLVQTYADRATSGGSLMRPGIQALIADAMACRFEVVVAEALDRISRDQEDVAGVIKRMRFAGVRVVTLSEGEISELHVGLKGTMNALFLKDLADKTRRGLRGRIEAGRSGGGLTYGYDVIDARDDAGNPVRGGRRINDEEAEVVRRIFRAYAAGQSPRSIALALNRDGIAGPRGAAWGQSTINGNARRGTGILNNELYIGRMVWNRLRYIKDPDTGKRVSRLNPPDTWVIHDEPDLRIVPQDLWDAVKARQAALAHGPQADARNDARPPWERRRPKYLLSGLVKCGVCGGGYVQISKTLLGCASARNKGTCDNRLNIRRDTLEATILDGLRNHLMEPDLFKEFVTAFHTELNRLRGSQDAEQETARNEIAQIDRQLERLVDAVLDGGDARILNAKMRDLEARKLTLETRLGEAKAPQPRLHPNLAEVYRRKVADLHDALADPADGHQAMEQVRALVDKVELMPFDGALRIDLHGAIAGILTLCQEGKKPGHDVWALCSQLELVAGAGFEPATFRL